MAKTVLGTGLLATSLLATLGAAAQDVASAGRQKEVSFGLGAGWCEPNDYAGAPYWSGALRLDLGRSLVLEPEIGYSKSTETFQDVSRTSRRDLSGSIALLWQSAGDAVRVSAGPGIGLHSVHLLLERYPDEYSAGGTDEYDETKLGIHAQLGLDVALGRALWLFGLARYDLLKGTAQNEGKLVAGLRYRQRTKDSRREASDSGIR